MKSKNLHEKNIVVLTARTNPGESPSSYVMKGLVDHLLNFEDGNEWAAYLRDNFYFVIVPMVNIDGVSIGNSRCSLAGNDLTRAWDKPDRFLQPEVYYTKKLLEKLRKDNNIVFFTDMHTNYYNTDCYVLGCQATKSREYGVAMTINSNLYDHGKSKFNVPVNKRAHSYSVMSSEFGVSYSYSLQISSSQTMYSTPIEIPDYIRLGGQYLCSIGSFLSKKFPVISPQAEVRDQQTSEAEKRRYVGLDQPGRHREDH